MKVSKSTTFKVTRLGAMVGGLYAYLPHSSSSRLKARCDDEVTRKCVRRMLVALLPVACALSFSDCRGMVWFMYTKLLCLYPYSKINCFKIKDQQC